MSEDHFIISRASEDNTLAAVTIRREVDRIERSLENHAPGIVAMIGLNMITRQLHLLHATDEESRQWIDKMAEAMKQSITKNA